MHNGRTERIRLYGVDCPEKNQAFDKTVTVRPPRTDHYKRTLGWVFVGMKSLNSSLVEQGMAWHYKQYAPHAPREMKPAALEMVAHGSSRGM